MATTKERLASTLATIAGAFPDRPGTAAESECHTWHCDGCGRVHTENPERCDVCGFTVFSRSRTRGPPARWRTSTGNGSAVPDVTGPDRIWECAECGSTHAENPEECHDCGYTVFTRRPSPDRPGTVERTDASEDPVSTTIVEEVAEREGTRPADLRPLYEVVDPDALDSLVRSTESGAVTFTYCGYTVTVYGDGTARFRDDT